MIDKSADNWLVPARGGRGVLLPAEGGRIPSQPDLRRWKPLLVGAEACQLPDTLPALTTDSLKKVAREDSHAS